VLRLRMSADAEFQFLPYGESLVMGGVEISFHPAVTVHTPGRQISENWPFLKGRLQPQKGHVAANHRRADFEVAARRPGSGAVFVGENC
ncbi:MAG: hypothetical protein WCQ77_16600, partial [Planctomycetota bacterium]